MAWIRVDTDLEMDRKFRRLSGVGRALLQFTWRLAKRKEGRIDADDWDVHYFSDMIGFADSEDDIKKSMNDIVSLGFLERFEGGNDLFVPNWEKFQNPKDRTNAERQKRYREKLRAEQITGVTGRNGVTNVTITDNAVHTYVPTDNTVHTDTFSTDLEKRVFQSMQDNYSDRVSDIKYNTYIKLVQNLSSSIYSGVDVCTEIKRAAIWEDNNPSKKKTPRGVPRFLCGWMDRAQNSGQRTIRNSSEPKQDYKEL